MTRSAERAREAASEAAKAAQEREAKPGVADPVPPDDERNWSKIVLNYVGKLGRVVGAALGVGGVVAVAGAAVMWQRFNEVDLPADQAVEVIPEDQLIVTGAVGLAVLAAIGLGGAILAFAVNPLGSVTPGSIIATMLLVLVAFLWTWFGTEVTFWPLVALTLFALVLALGSLGVAELTGRRFVPFGAAIVVSGLLFGAALNFAVAAEENKIQPAAVLQANGTGISGFYVADTDDHIWLGIPRRRKNKDGELEVYEANLQRISRDDKTKLLVGPPIGKDAAARRAKRLLPILKDENE